MFGNLMTCSYLVSIIINCHACLATSLEGNNEGQSNTLKVNQASYQGGANRWMPWHENPLYQRYHSPGSDFAGRGYPIRFSQDDVANALGVEPSIDVSEDDQMTPSVGLDLAELEKIMSLLNNQHGLNARKKRELF